MRHNIANADLSLRAVTPQDFPLLERWLQKEYIKKWYGDPGEWLQEIRNEQGDFDWINHFMAVYQQNPIGFCQYYDCCKTPTGFEWEHEPPGTYAVDYLIGEEGCLGQGLGSVILQKLCELVIARENPSQLVADPVPENINSIKLLERHGFRLDATTGLYKLPIR